MSLFALGTTPGLLGAGGIISTVNAKYSNYFYKFIGVLVIVMSFYNISNGLNLTGLNNFFANVKLGSTQSEQSSNNSQMVISGGNVQVFKTEYNSRDVLKNKSFVVKKNIPVRIEIYAQEDGVGCMGSIMIPGLVRQPQFFEKGKTISLEFTPTREGRYSITCAMGVPAGTVTVE